jgi:hypothetical protein
LAKLGLPSVEGVGGARQPSTKTYRALRRLLIFLFFIYNFIQTTFSHETCMTATRVTGSFYEKIAQWHEKTPKLLANPYFVKCGEKLAYENGQTVFCQIG